MAFTDLRIPNASADAVAIFDQDFNQIVANARPIKVTVSKIKQIMDHPVETGAVISDHAILKPVEIELSLILLSSDYRATYARLDQYYEASTILSVQSKASTYSNMVITSMPHDEDPSAMDVLFLAIRLREAEFVTAQYGTLPASKVKNAGDASTINKGKVETQKEGTNNASIAKNTKDAISNYFKPAQP